MVKDIEERVERLRCSCPLLDIIDNQHVDTLIESNKVVDRVPASSICKLHLEETGRNIKYALTRVHFFTTHTNGVDEMRLSTTRGSIDKEGIES